MKIDRRAASSSSFPGLKPAVHRLPVHTDARPNATALPVCIRTSAAAVEKDGQREANKERERESTG